MVGELADQNMRQKTWAWPSTINRHHQCWNLMDDLKAAAGHLGPYRSDDFEATAEVVWGILWPEPAMVDVSPARATPDGLVRDAVNYGCPFGHRRFIAAPTRIVTSVGVGHRGQQHGREYGKPEDTLSHT